SQTSMLVLESDADYARYGIDRTALAEILAIGPSGVELVHRAPAPVQIAAPQPPATASPLHEAKLALRDKAPDDRDGKEDREQGEDEKSGTKQKVALEAPREQGEASPPGAAPAAPMAPPAAPMAAPVAPMAAKEALDEAKSSGVLAGKAEPSRPEAAHAAPPEAAHAAPPPRPAYRPADPGPRSDVRGGAGAGTAATSAAAMPHGAAAEIDTVRPARASAPRLPRPPTPAPSPARPAARI